MKNLLKCISIFLVLTLMFPDVFRIITYAIDSPTYISDVQMAYAATTDSADTESARRSLTNAGYTVVESNLNSGTDRPASFVGYKTTKDEKEAITDLAIMDMDGGYELNCFAATLDYYKSSIGEKADGLMVACKEMKSNFDKGSPAAKLSMMALNYIVVTEANNQMLGEYLISPARVQKDYYDIVLKCDPNILTFIIAQVAGGVADYKTKTTWLERYVKPDPKVKFTPDKYHDRAKKIYPRFEEFGKRYEAALEAIGEVDSSEAVDPSSYAASSGSSSTDDAESSAIDDTASGSTSADEAVPEKENSKATPEMIRTVASYEILNKYISKGDGVGDIFAYIQYASELYPLVEALTPGQLAMLEITDIETCVNMLLNSTDVAEKNYATAVAMIEKESAVVKGTSLWENTVKEIFEDNKEIAMTNRAVRETTATNNLEALARVDPIKAGLSTGLNIISGVAGIAFLTATISWSVVSAAAGLTTGFTAVFATLGTAFSASIGAVVAATIFVASVAFLALSIIGLIGIGIYYLVDAIKKSIEYNNPTFKDIPADMYDFFEGLPDPDNPDESISKYIGYDVVRDQYGKPGDLNAWNGLKWNALYYTKDRAAGSPIKADFIAKTGDAVVPVGYSPMHKFGEVSAYNINNHMREDSLYGNFLFFQRKEGNKTALSGEFLSDLIVKEGETESEVLSYFTQKGYTSLKINLTPRGGHAENTKVAFLGYKTTRKESSAIRDIRVAYSCDTKEVRIGEATYGNGGAYSGMTLYYSKVPSAGDPVLADFFLARQISEKPPSDDFVPISLISGGPAANLALPIQPYASTIRASLLINDSKNYAPTEMEQVYLYYRSSVSYTGPDYVSGFASFQYTDRDAEYSIEDKLSKLIPAMGYTDTGRFLTNDYSFDYNSYRYDVYVNKIAYSTTKNTYRALKKIYTYTSKDYYIKLPPFTTRDGIGYAAVPRYDITRKDVARMNGSVPNERRFYPELNTTSSLVQYNSTTGMYVTSGTKQGEYISPNDFYFTADSQAPKSGYIAVSDWYDKSNSPANLKEGCWTSGQIYMYIKAPKPEVNKYISNIIVGTSEESVDYAKLGLFAQGSSDALTNIDDYGAIIEKGSTSSTYVYTTLGFQRSSDVNMAITDIKTVAYDVYKKPAELPLKISVNGLTYQLASQNPFAYNKYYYGLFIYYCTNPAAGNPITEIQWMRDVRFGGSAGYEASETIDDQSLMPGCLSRYALAYTGQYSEILYLKRTTTANNVYLKSIGGLANSYYWDGLHQLAISGFSYVGRNASGTIMDMNQTNGGDYVFVGYNKTDDKNDSITGLVASVQSKGSYMWNTITHNGINYAALPLSADFNSDCTNSYAIYLYYTKDPRAGSPITDIRCSFNMYEVDGGYGWGWWDNMWSPVSNTQNQTADFNAGDYNCDPSPMYILYKRANGVVSERPSSNYASVFISMNPISTTIMFAALILAGTGLIVYQKRRRRKVKVKVKSKDV